VGVTRPLAIDLFCGLGGWTDGLLAEGYDVIGFDIERHEYGEHRYPGLLAIQDVLTLHGSQFRDAALIVASPPCQEFSYMAMPWKLAKAKAAAIRSDASGKAMEDLTRLFNACFRIRRQACDAAGHHIPLIVENVRGAVPWVGRSRWNFGSYYLWGDVPALMPIGSRLLEPKVPLVNGLPNNAEKPGYVRRPLNGNPSHVLGYKSSGMNWSDQTKRGQDFTRVAGRQAVDGVKGVGCGFKHDAAGKRVQDVVSNAHGKARKFASAMIAKIPEALSRHIAVVFKP
jgi:hypothetical protein